MSTPVRPAGRTAPVVCLDTLIRLRRGQRNPRATRHLTLPEGMTAPMGCDAVAVPADLGPEIMPRLPRVGCVYADDRRWWWLVPADSDYALRWPAPAQYTTGALLSGMPTVPGLVHRPAGTIPYTPPIPLYLALCRATGTTPAWTEPLPV
ncbi:hypothetical protein [Streptomyces poonensis]|uniref:Uncharacterized protein n=1 Tax=Streptomyces poonensis TaxID=68255 RepID=A0A918Q363_9ACTN|nr:hypothetical protein [Streptomyces poonensis]GGZ30713.1 hypothetical protein GCM10010365_58990 [Streptomyces poonensis]GLJ88224.1 hypothetical protein GCM10017589_08240 [Streptomyces poonensis]